MLTTANAARIPLADGVVRGYFALRMASALA